LALSAKNKDKDPDEKLFASLEFNFFRVHLKLAFRIRPLVLHPQNIRSLTAMALCVFKTVLLPDERYNLETSLSCKLTQNDI